MPPNFSMSYVVRRSLPWRWIDLHQCNDPDHLLEAKQMTWLQIARWLTGIIFVGAVIAVILDFADITRFIATIQRMEPRWLLLAAITQAMTYRAAAGIRYRVLHRDRHRLGFLLLFRLSLAQLFAEQALPSSGLTGALVVAKGLVNRGIEEGVGMGCMLVGIISCYAGYLLAIAASFVILFNADDRRDPDMVIMIALLGLRLIKSTKR